VATTGDILKQISFLAPGSTAQNHLLSGLGRVKILGLNLSVDIESLRTDNNTEVNALDLETMTESNSTLKTESLFNVIEISQSSPVKTSNMIYLPKD